MKKTVYFDSTIPSYLFDDRDSIRYLCKITKKWFDEEQQNYHIFVSVETIAELSSGNYPGKEKIMDFVKNLERLEPIPEISQIANYYIENRLMPEDVKGDAAHLAYASFYKIDFLLTWNCNHLANANKKQHIRVLNNRLNLFVPEIITPLELFTEK